MTVAATGFRINGGSDLNTQFWGYTGNSGDRIVTDSNGNCNWNCACNACNSNCNCNCGNCRPAALPLNIYVTDWRLNVFRNTAYADGLRHDNQDQSMGMFRFFRNNCNCNCNCACNCACDCNCACNC